MYTDYNEDVAVNVMASKGYGMLGIMVQERLNEIIEALHMQYMFGRLGRFCYHIIV